MAGGNPTHERDPGAADHPFASLDLPAAARALAQIADRPGDLVDAYFERTEEVTLPPDDRPGPAPGVEVRREEGLAIRLVRDGRVWLSARDSIDAHAFSGTLRRAARALPAAAYPEPDLVPAPWPGPAAAPEVLELPSRLARAVRARRAAFALRLTVRRHRRWLQVIGGEKLLPAPERESFYSLDAELPWGDVGAAGDGAAVGGAWRQGALLPELTDAAVDEVAELLVALFRARQAAPPEPWRGPVVLAPAAAAVFLHEAVAHALEADVLAAGGDPRAAIGVALGSPLLDVLDDPSSAPAPVRRTSDDEGRAVHRRWLLRGGRVQEPLADALWSAACDAFSPGAGRRSGRHALPGPRSTHLELVAGATSEADLLAAAEGGLLLPTAGRGTLDPRTGTFRLAFPFAQRIRGGAAAEPVGPCRLAGTVADLLSAVAAVGDRPRPAGAGWCAKGGQKLPVWATAPAVLLEGVEVTP
jgi:predicted Zn-dependent protease